MGWDYEVLIYLLKKLENETSNYFAFVNASSNHTPFAKMQEPFNKYEHGSESEGGYLNMLHYSDWAIGKFIAEFKKRDDFEISYPCVVVTGRDDKELAAASVATKQQIAFYGSTPAYRPVLDSIGVGELQPELNAMSKQGRWVEMGGLITDDIMQSFAVSGEPETIAEQIQSRYGDIVDRTSAAYAQLPKDDRIKIVPQLTGT